MKAIICTKHGKPFRCAGLDLTPEEQEFEITEDQLKDLKRAESPKTFKGFDGAINGGGGVIRVKVLADAPAPAKPGK